MPTQVRTPLARIVYGHPTKAVPKTNMQTKQPVLKDGKPVMVRNFGIAIPKAEFQAQVWPAMYQEAATVYPGAQVPQHFAWKFKDGDGIDRQGKPYSQREGYAGCIVLSISTELPVPVWHFNPQTNQFEQVPDDGIKCGDYVSVALNLQGNKPSDPTATPGLYVNPQGVELMFYGQAIVNSPPPETLFGAGAQRPQYQMPPGASMSPIAAGNGAVPPGMGGAPQPQQPAYGAMQMPPAMGQPQPGYQPQGQPQPGYQPQGQPQPGYGAPPMGNLPAGGGAPMMGNPATVPAQNGYPAPNGAAGYPSNALPPPAPDFVANAAGYGQQPQAQPGMPGAGNFPMPGR